MFSTILDYIEYLEGIKTNMKALHWDSRNMSEHKLCDEILTSVNSFQDDFAEEFQGIYGRRISVKMFKPQKSSFKSPKALVKDLIQKTTVLHKQLNRRRYTGLRAIMEQFIHDMNKNSYLLDFAIKEDVKREIVNTINEALKKKTLNEDYNDHAREDIIKKFLDKTYGKGQMPIMKGMTPSYRDVFFYKDMKGNLIKPVTAREVFYNLQDEFQGMYSSQQFLNKMIKRVMKQWFYGV